MEGPTRGWGGPSIFSTSLGLPASKISNPESPPITGPSPILDHWFESTFGSTFGFANFSYDVDELPIELISGFSPISVVSVVHPDSS